ncbi:MAG: AsmA family protein [Elusimicrobium sp.]|jgi:AsmA protein|nr:AsmA family protein [Elusimicrobium sp.]
MKKLIKIAAVLGIIFVILVVAAAVAVRRMFPPEKIYAMVHDYVKTNYNREIKFDDVSFRIIGVDLSNFAISEKGTFENGTFAKADNIVVKIALAPLLRKNIKVSTIGLEGFAAAVTRDEKGQFNFADLIPAEDKTPPAPAAPKDVSAQGMQFNVNVDKFYVTNASLDYKDKQSDMTASVKDFNLNVNKFALDGDFDADASLTANYADKDRRLSVPLSAKITANLKNNDFKTAYINIRSLSGTLNGASFQASAGITNFDNPLIDLNGSFSGVSDKTLAGLASGMPAFTLPATKFAAKVQTNLQASSADVQSFSLNLPKSNAGGSAKINWGGKDLVYSANTNFNLFIDELAAIVPQMTAQYKATGTASGAIATTNANLAKGSVKLAQVGADYNKMATLKDFAGTLTVNSVDNIKTDTFKGSLNDAPFTGNLAYAKTANNRYKVDLNFNLDSFTMKELPAAAQSSASSSGAASTPAKYDPKAPVFDVKSNITVGKISAPNFTSAGSALTADISGAEPSMTQLNGLVNFDVKAGQINGLNDFLNSSKIVRVLFGAVAIAEKAFAFLNLNILAPGSAKAATDSVPFDSITGVYNFKNGVMSVDKTSFVSNLTTIQAGGTVDLTTNKLNMTINTFPGKQSANTTPLVMKVGGTIDNPKPSLNALATASSLLSGGNAGAVKDTATSAVNSAKSALQSIGGLFKK